MQNCIPTHTLIFIFYNLYIRYKRQTCLYLPYLPTYDILYAFLNRSSDCYEIWYRDRLDLGDEGRLHFVTEKIVRLLFFVYKWLLLVLIIIIIIIIIIINAIILCILVQNVSSSNYCFGGPIFCIF